MHVVFIIGFICGLLSLNAEELNYRRGNRNSYGLKRLEQVNVLCLVILTYQAFQLGDQMPWYWVALYLVLATGISATIVNKIASKLFIAARQVLALICIVATLVICFY